MKKRLIKKLIEVSVFSLLCFLLFACNQRTEKKNGNKLGGGKFFRVTFEEPHFGTLSATHKDGSPFVSGQLAKENEELIFTVTCHGDYTVKAWKGAVQDKNNPVQAHLVVKEETEVSVRLKGKEFRLTYGVDGQGGSLTACLDSKQIVHNGDRVERGTVIFTAMPLAGYKVKEWKSKGGDVKFGGYQGANTMIMLLNTDADVRVSFVPKKS